MTRNSACLAFLISGALPLMLVGVLSENDASGDLVPIPPGKMEATSFHYEGPSPITGKMETISFPYDGPLPINSNVEPAKKWNRSQLLLVAAVGIAILLLGSGIFSLRNRSRKTGPNDQ